MLHTLFTVLVVNAVYFIQFSHPVAMGLSLIFHTAVVGLITGVVADNFIYSYILFLIILGGVLVLFIYMTSLASNEVFSSSWTDLFYCMIMMMFLSLSLAVFFIPGVTNFKPMESLTVILCFKNDAFGLEKLYSDYSYMLTLFLVVYLLYVLLVCACVANQNHGSLRKFN